jgi:hypothetical protein
MNTYQLIVMTCDGSARYTICAEEISTTTNSSTSSGYYAFYADSKLISCFPIERTIIASIEYADGN